MLVGWTGGRAKYSYLDDGLFSLDAGFHTILLDRNIEVLALEVAGDFDGDLKVGDGLGPFVRELALLFLLFGFGVCVEALAL